MPETRAVRPTMSAETAFAVIAGGCCEEMGAHLPAFFASDDPAGVHKARVALRRLTTALDAFEPVLKPRKAAALREAAKAIFRELGRVRDADVLAAHLAGGRRGRKQQERAARVRAEARRHLRKRDAREFPDRLAAKVASGALLGNRPAARAARAGPVAELAEAALDRAWTACLSHGPDLREMPDRDRHEFRKDAKTFRYLAEFFAALWPRRDWPPLRERLQELQDGLGLLNDLANARGQGAQADPAAEGQAMERAAALWRDLARTPMWWAARAPARPAPEN